MLFVADQIKAFSVEGTRDPKEEGEYSSSPRRNNDQNSPFASGARFCVYPTGVGSAAVISDIICFPLGMRQMF